MFEIKLNDGRTVCRHLDQIQLQTNTTGEQSDELLPIDLPSVPVEEPQEPEITQSETDSLPVPPPRRSTRNRQPPEDNNHIYSYSTQLL